MTQKRPQLRRSDVFIVNFKQISQSFIVNFEPIKFCWVKSWSQRGLPLKDT